MSMTCKVETGIDSFSLYCTLTPKQKNQILAKLKELSGFQIRVSDYWKDNYEYSSDHFKKKGLKLTISKKHSYVWGLFIVVHPTLLQGDHDRSSLYRPHKLIFKELMKNANRLLEDICIPCKLEEMNLYRADITANLIFTYAVLVDEHLRLLKKSLLLPSYQLDWFRKKEHKARDVMDCPGLSGQHKKAPW